MRTNTKQNAVIAVDRNHEGTPVKRLSAIQELRRTVLTCMLFEDQHYESGEDAAARIAALIPKCDPGQVAELAHQARNAMNLRHVPLFIVREMARHEQLRSWVGALLPRIIQRPDELAEFVALYWKEKRQPLCAQAKKGLALAFQKFNAYQLAKYNRDGQVKLRDVLFLCHAKPKDEEQAKAFKQLVDGTLPVPDTWETELSAGKEKKETWVRLIAERKLGALALLRNLRNMLEVGVEEAVIKAALEEMRTDRVLPFRFIAAARYAPRLEPQLEGAMLRCLEGKPLFGGVTAIVIDTSPSMWGSKVSAKSELDRFDAAAALAILLQASCEQSYVYAFNDKAYEVPSRKGFALRDALASTKSNCSRGGLAVAECNKRGYDRIVVLTDGQWHYSPASNGEKVRIAGQPLQQMIGNAQVVSPAPLTENAYMINVAGYRNGVGYGKWTSIDGWSENIVQYIAAAEAV